MLVRSTVRMNKCVYAASKQHLVQGRLAIIISLCLHAYTTVKKKKEKYIVWGRWEEGHTLVRQRYNARWRVEFKQSASSIDRPPGITQRVYITSYTHAAFLIYIHIHIREEREREEKLEFILYIYIFLYGCIVECVYSMTHFERILVFIFPCHWVYCRKSIAIFLIRLSI